MVVLPQYGQRIRCFFIRVTSFFTSGVRITDFCKFTLRMLYVYCKHIGDVFPVNGRGNRSQIGTFCHVLPFFKVSTNVPDKKLL